jgi:hypothetical protein
VTTSSSPPAAPARRPGRDAPTESSVERIVAIAILVILAVLFLVTAWSRISAPFADSDDGINGAVWGANSRGLRELGPLESRMGGVRVDQTKYATHPPLIVTETAVIEVVVGEHPWATRAPAWLGSLAAIVVAFLLLRSLGLGAAPAAATTAAAMAANMVFVYGVMLDTMVIAFPFALGVALVWHRQWTGAAKPRAWLVFALATVTCLGGWQAIFLVGLCAVATAARFRSRPGAIREALPYAAAVVVGVGLTLGWAYWVYGSFAVLDDKLLRRTGGTEPISLADMASFQVPWLSQLLGVGFLGWIACAVSLRDHRFRPLAALSLASVILYAVFLKEGSGGHQYWNYWGLFPAIIGLAYVFDAVTTAVRRSAGARSPMLLVAPIVLAVLVVAVNVTRPNQAGDLIESGYAPYRLIERTPLAAGQTDIPYLAEPFRIDDWLRYRGGPPGRPLLDADELHALAREHPDFQVLVLGSCASPDPTKICERLTFGAAGPAASPPPRFENAATLEKQLNDG